MEDKETESSAPPPAYGTLFPNEPIDSQAKQADTAEPGCAPHLVQNYSAQPGYSPEPSYPPQPGYAQPGQQRFHPSGKEKGNTHELLQEVERG